MTILLKWIEWSHPPTWTIVAWMLVGLFNYYHWFVLKDYAGIVGSSFGMQLVEGTRKRTEPEEDIALIATNKMQ